MTQSYYSDFSDSRASLFEGFPRLVWAYSFAPPNVNTIRVIFTSVLYASSPPRFVLRQALPPAFNPPQI